MSHTEKTIITQLYRMKSHHSQLVAHNIYLFHPNWESDFIYLTKTDYVHEVEIKISVADYELDFTTKDWKHKALKEKTYGPRSFSYCVPEGMIGETDVPEYAGLMYAHDNSIEVVKKAPTLKQIPHCTKERKAKILESCYYKHTNFVLAEKSMAESNDEVKRLRDLLDQKNATIRKLKATNSAPKRTIL